MNYRGLFNLGTNIVAFVVFAVLLLISIFSGGVKKKIDAIFSVLIANVMLAFGFNAVFYYLLVNGADNNNLYVAMKTIAFTFLNLSALSVLVYCVFYFELSKKNTIIILVVGSLLFVVTIVLISFNYFSNFFFSIHNKQVVTTNLYFINYSYLFIVFVWCFVLALVRQNLKRTERVSFIFFSLIPLLALIFHSIFLEYSILTFAYCASFLFHYVFYYVERGAIINKQQNELTEQQINVMVSQIQPHFIYNCLSSISYLCRKDPKKAELAINDFSNYLRGNLSNLSKNKIVPFNKELEYTQNYLKLEKLRFEDRVNVVYDIKVDNFFIPSLSLQPIVENAVKHGICKKINGGTVTISTWDDNKHYFIKVSDNGVGYDLKAPANPDDRVHVGLANTTERFEKMCHGEVSVKSKINVGTTVVMTIPKKQEKAGGGRK